MTHQTVVRSRRRIRDLFKRTWWLKCTTCNFADGPFANVDDADERCVKILVGDVLQMTPEHWLSLSHAEKHAYYRRHPAARENHRLLEKMLTPPRVVPTVKVTIHTNARPKTITARMKSKAGTMLGFK